VRSGNYRPLFKGFFWIFAVVCVALGYLGSKPAEGLYVVFSQILTVYYFAHFLVILPLLGLLESPKPLPSSISDDVLAKSRPATAAVPAE
jgi:quinol-cytochrome oxidoreductase complex cytochrome b subunit